MESQDILITVVIPCYNREKNIKSTIFSVLNQTYKNFEIIVVDDASSDSTVDIIKSIKDERIKLIELESNTKGTKPRNIGIQNSKGELIAFLDSDDLWDIYKLEKQVEYMKEKGIENTCCFTDLYVIENGKKRKVNNGEFPFDKDIMEYIFVERNVVQTSSIMIDADLAKKTLFNENVVKHQDWDFYLRVKRNEGVFKYLNIPLSYWVWDINISRISTNKSLINYSQIWLSENEKYLSKKAYWGFKAYVEIPNLLKNGKRVNALKILFNAFNAKAINGSNLLKEIIKISLGLKSWNKMRNKLLNLFRITKEG